MNVTINLKYKLHFIIITLPLDFSASNLSNDEKKTLSMKHKRSNEIIFAYLILWVSTSLFEQCTMF